MIERISSTTHKDFKGGNFLKKRILLFALVLVMVTAMAIPTAFAGKPISPTVTITSPADGSTVSGSVTISADCSGGASGVTVTKVEYAIDGGAAVKMTGPDGSESGSWSANWDSTTVGDGSHTIAVTATNSQGKTTSKSVKVTVSNGGSSDPHANLLWADYPSNCLGCHKTNFQDMYQALHYQWQGNAPDNLNQPDKKQGKISNEVNSYCINILGNWAVCGKCHAGRGAQPVATLSPSDDQLKNIDCLMCHNEAYALDRDRLADGSMGPKSTDTTTLNSYVRNIAKPTRTNCLKCHGFAGGGDSVKRGDITWAHRGTGDSTFDVHMSTARGNLVCQACHTFTKHKVDGKGSDLRVTDGAAEIKCTKCHTTKGDATGHVTAAVNNHVVRVACQTCHIPKYAKNASDTPESEATEVHRSWKEPTKSTSTPYHPPSVKANDLIPKYKFWNRKSFSALLYDIATLDPVTSAFPTSRPDGTIDGALGTKLYAFKYKTAEQPMRDANKVLIALDTKYYMLTSPDPVEATKRGLVNMGYSSTDSFSWVKTDTYQMLNHEIPPATGVLQCSNCHENTAQMNLPAMGYTYKDAKSVVCSQCHKEKNWKGYVSGHDRHVTSKKYDCSWCHKFSRPERGLTMP